jgi:hypothetical protein
MPDCATAARLSPDDRLREIATILASGILRLRQRAALPTEDALENPAELSAAGLEVSDETVLSVHTG